MGYFVLALTLVTLSSDVFAAAQNAPWSSTAEFAVSILTGAAARSMAVLAIAGCGIGTMFGYMRKEWAFALIAGIMMIFGSATIADLFIGAVN